MAYLRKLVALALVLAMALAAVLWTGSGTASACSCAGIDAIDVIAQVDMVFTGTPIANDGTAAAPVWRFSVDGVIKGDVGSEVVLLGDGPGGCAPDFSHYIALEAIVVYAYEAEDGWRAQGCTSAPFATDFADLLAAVEPPTGRGPPVAIMSGIYRHTDLAVIDGQGRTITRGSINSGYGAIAHCSGTTTAAIVASYPESLLSLIDLASMAVIQQRPHSGGFMHQDSGMIACLDGGATIITLSGYGPDNQTVELNSNTRNADGEDEEIRISFSDVSRAVVHPQGTVILLPSKANEPVRTLNTPGLEPLPGGQTQLLVDAATVAGDISPDGLQLAILVTLDGTDVAWDTGATHVVVIELDEGVPVGEPLSVVALMDPGLTNENAAGAAKWIRWIDDSTWIVESETQDGKRARIVSTDGSQIVDNMSVDWGSGLTPIPAGVLRSTMGGIEIITKNGTTVAGDPAPLGEDSYVDRYLWIAPLVGAPDFALATIPSAPLEIRPVAAGTVVEGPPATTGDGSAKAGRRWVVSLLAASALVATVAGMHSLRRSRHV